MADMTEAKGKAAPHQPVAYSPVMKTFHWTTVALVATLLALGWTMTSDLETIKPIRGALFALHKSLGLTILLLTVLRICWRSTHPVPPMPPVLRPWEVAVFKTVHYLLYTMLLVQPLVGWTIVTIMQKKSLFFGLFPFPDLPLLPAFQNPKAAADFLGNVHAAGAMVLVALLVLHVGAAFRHHFLIRDNVLFRMAPTWLGPWLARLRKEM